MEGPEKGKRGKINGLLKLENQVTIEDLNRKERKVRPHPQLPDGGSVFVESGIHYSNIQLLDPISKYFRRWCNGG
jgi:large subunit ribosomal protein L24